jgi:hypothetical protein
MSEIEKLFKEITSVHKWYAGKMSAQHASMIKRKHKKGEYSLAFYDRFFGRFGYEIENITWKKK